MKTQARFIGRKYNSIGSVYPVQIEVELLDTGLDMVVIAVHTKGYEIHRTLEVQNPETGQWFTPQGDV